MPTPQTTRRRGRKSRRANSDTTRQWQWGASEEEAFAKLKSALTSYPILAYPDFKKTFELHTDASLLGLGAVLYQEQEGRKRVIAYASRGLSRSEKNYPAHKMEFLALKWAVTEKFHDYLFGHSFTVLTDNNPLTYVLTSAKLDATSQRWVAALANYNFNIVYRPGSASADADSLSRLPGLLEKPQDTATIPSDSIKALCKATNISPLIDSLTTSTEVISDFIYHQHVTTFDMERAQEEDSDLRWWKPYVRRSRRPDKSQVDYSPIHRTLYREFDRLRLLGNVLYRRVSMDGQERHQLVVPKSHISRVLKLVHDEMGHQGRDKTTSLVRDRFFWFGMSRDIEDYVKKCQRCILRKAPTTQKAPLVNITSSYPLELVCMDFLSLETSKGGFHSILVITDHFTRYAIAVPTRNQTAKTTADAFFKNFVVHYGLPARIHSDQGANFESRLISELCSVTGIEKSRTTPYHPAGNGLCERFNRTLLNMLGTLEDQQKQDWKSHVTSLVHAYNCTRQDSTGQSPYFLMFGREPRLPVDLVFDLQTNNDDQSLTQYAEGLKERLRTAYKLASDNTSKAQKKQKDTYDRNIRSSTVHTGDLVLVKLVAFDGKHKLSNKWEKDTYRVLDQPNKDIPVYVVQKESGEGRQRTLHRNMLLPIDTPMTPPTPPKKTRPTPAPRKRRVPQRDTEISATRVDRRDESSSEESDEEVVLEFVMPDTNVHTDVPLDQTNEEIEPEGEPDTEPEQVVGDALQDEAAGPDAAATHDGNDEGERPMPPPQPPPPQPPLRRSERERRPPQWFTSGDYAMSLQNLPEWLQKAEYLRTLDTSGVLQGSEGQVKDTFIKIVSSSNNT